MLKNTEGDTLTLCIESELKTYKSAHLIAVSNNTCIKLTLHIETKESLADLTGISNYHTITAERYVVEGTAGDPISAIPIIAIYDGDTVRKSVAVGDSVTLNGSLQVFSQSISVPTVLFQLRKQLCSFGKIFRCKQH